VEQHNTRDRIYHDTIATQYDRVVVHPRWHSIDWLFSDAPSVLSSKRSAMLDLGSGTGHMLMRFGKQFDRVVALDHSSEMLAVARRNFVVRPQQSVDFVADTVNRFLAADVRLYHLITCVGCAHHLLPTDLPEFFVRIRKRLSPGGVFLIAEPITGVPVAEPGWLSRWNHWYRTHPELYATDAIDPEEGPIDYQHLLRSLGEAGLKVVKQRRGWEVFPRNLPPSLFDKAMTPILCRLTGNTGPVLTTYCRAD
jgi:SAM-dependent methyltransferase